MAVTIDTTTQAGPNAWRLTWSSSLSDPTFYVYRDGQLVTTTTATAMTFTVAAGESPTIEILDAPPEVSPSVYPSRMLLTWYDLTASGDAAPAHYRVEEYVNSTWTLRQRINADAFYYRWTSRVLEDGVTHQFRVRAVAAVPAGSSSSGNLGTATTLTVLMVRIPDAPNASYSYDADTGDVTVSLET